MRIRHYLVLSALAAITAVSGCGDSATQYVTYKLPNGFWSYETFDSQTDPTHRYVSSIALSDTLGVLSDTTFVKRNDIWEVDSVTTRRLEYQTVYEGYQRAVQVRTSTGVDRDTSLAYWYFFERGDSLYYYTGMRFLGFNAGLAGTWRTDPQDSILLHGALHLTFNNGVVVISRRSSVLGDSDNSYPYSTRRDTLAIDGLSTFYGDRYEISPGSALYITTHPKRGYGLVHKP